MTKPAKRPLSPHLQIYSLPVTAKLSILHRISGAALVFLLPLLILIFTSLLIGEDGWVLIQAFFSHWAGKIIIWGFIFSLYYHFCNGIRHLIWDFSIHMDKQQMTWSAFIVISLSLFLTIITAALH